MRTAAFTLTLVSLSMIGWSQTGTRPLPPFDKILASQHVSLVLEKGDSESIRLVYSGIEDDQLNVKVKRGKLMVYLDDARFAEKREKYYVNGYKHTRSRYPDAQITAYVTYKELRSVEIRGEDELVCKSELEGDKVKLKAYGEIEISLSSVKADKFKASLFGSNKMKIYHGETGHQTYRLFGENTIDAHQVTSNTISSRIFGEGTLKVKAYEELRLTAMGEPTILLDGPARINKNIVFGEPDIRVRR